MEENNYKGSIIVCAFFHDLGKASKSTRHIKDHEGRFIRLLDKFGFTLTNQERNAIITHHNKDGFFDDLLRMRLSLADLNSANKWLEEMTRITIHHCAI